MNIKFREPPLHYYNTGEDICDLIMFCTMQKFKLIKGQNYFEDACLSLAAILGRQNALFVLASPVQMSIDFSDVLWRILCGNNSWLGDILVGVEEEQIKKVGSVSGVIALEALEERILRTSSDFPINMDRAGWLGEGMRVGCTCSG